jgi:hypothetical protein
LAYFATSRTAELRCLVAAEFALLGVAGCSKAPPSQRLPPEVTGRHRASAKHEGVND